MLLKLVVGAAAARPWSGDLGSFPGEEHTENIPCDQAFPPDTV